MQNFKVLFFLKQGKGSNGKPLPIYVRITINGKRSEWSVQRNCERDKWNQAAGRATGTKEEIRILNAYLDAIQGNIFALQKEFALRNESVTPALIKTRVVHEPEQKPLTLITVFKYHNEQFGKLVGLEFSYGTFKKFKSALNSLQAFIQWKFNKKDIYLPEVNLKFITEYEFYLKSVKKLQHNSAMGNIKKLKKIIRQCIANDWLDKDPFRCYKITTKETHRNFLLNHELEILKTKVITIPRLDQVRDIFLFSCYTGLAYSDVMKLSPKDISIGMDGEQWIFTTRIKTGTASRILLLPMVKTILAKYSKRPDIINSNGLLPRLTNQKLNGYLKEISDICGFEKQLTFHCARHTFATTVTLTNGVPIETVGKMLGHKSLRTTQIYAKILDNKISSDMQQLKQKLLSAI
jgi:site-specific recombinase XerD